MPQTANLAAPLGRGDQVMTIQAVLLPLFVEVVLTFVLLCGMAYARTEAFKRGAVRPADIALRQPNWPQRPTQLGNSFLNQFELPVLFYVLTILAWITRHADLLFVILAWVFVASRLVQAYIHVTHNDVRQRGTAFIVGAIVLMLMWLIFILRILLGI
jgi:hypothetical protein